MYKKIFAEFKGKRIEIEQIDDIAIEIHDGEVGKFIKEQNRLTDKETLYTINFYYEGFTSFGSYTECRNIITTDNGVVFMYRNKIYEEVV